MKALIETIDNNNFEPIIMPLAVRYFKRVMKKAKKHRSSKTFYKLKFLKKINDIFAIFSICFFIAYKMIYDLERLFIEDMSTLTGLEECVLEEVEVSILTDFLEFNLCRDLKNLPMEEYDLLNLSR